MNRGELIRDTIIGVLLFLGVCWSLTAAGSGGTGNGYPNADLIASPDWLKQHRDNDDLIIVDVRTDDHFDGELITGATRLPWSTFRRNNTARQVGSVFVGIDQAQQILGDHGIVPADTVVLYDSVARDGGATASYVFWVLEMLGHEKVRILNGGIDAWRQANGTVTTNAVTLTPQRYQAAPDAINTRSWGNGNFIRKRLGDPHYQIIDVRSRKEYLGETGNKDLNGKPLKLGHIPTAINIEYSRAWVDETAKRIKAYEALREVYRGVDPNRGTIVYCHSGRRSSFSYFVLRLMGFNDVIEYEAAWNEWGRPQNFFPTELTENQPASDALPGASGASGTDRKAASSSDAAGKPAARRDQSDVSYVSCGG